MSRVIVEYTLNWGKYHELRAAIFISAKDSAILYLHTSI